MRGDPRGEVDNVFLGMLRPHFFFEKNGANSFQQKLTQKSEELV